MSLLLYNLCELSYIHLCAGEQRSEDNYGRQLLSPSIVWVLGIKFWLSGMAAGAFTGQAISLALIFHSSVRGLKPGNTTNTAIKQTPATSQSCLISACEES